MKLNDAVFGVALLLFAAAVLLHTPSFPEMPGQDYGPALFPNLVAIGMAVTGLVLLAGGLRRRRAGQRLVDLGAWSESPHHLTNGLAVLAGLVLYILVADPLGFLPTSFLLLSALLVKLRQGHLLSSLGIALVTTLVVYYVFTRFLLVPLPVGVMRHLGLSW